MQGWCPRGLVPNSRTTEDRILWPWPWPRVGPALALALDTLSSNPLTDCNDRLCSGLSGLTRRMCELVLHYLFNTTKVYFIELLLNIK